jgi:ribosomal protein S18 acetylase RimI-like enzyme
LVAGSSPAGGANKSCDDLFSAKGVPFIQMRIREFQLNDYGDVVNVWNTAGLILRPGDEFDGVKLKLQRDPDLFLVAEDEDEIVGVVMGAWDGRRGWINHLAVVPNLQRQGIGHALIGEVEKRLIEKGAKKVNAQVYRSNTKSFDFFKSVGYEVHSDLVMIGKHLKK